MHRQGNRTYFLIIFIGLYLLGCEQKTSLTPIEIELPAHFPDTVPQPEHNAMTEEGVALGKKLFFDPALSKNGEISCATCHQPSLAFTDGVAQSEQGVSKKRLVRHAPALFNLAWQPAFFWDGGAENLESQVFGPLTHPDEMGISLKELVKKLEKQPEYPARFQQVFGTDQLQSAYIARALAQYMRSLISANAPFDAYFSGEKMLDTLALKGQKIFYEKECITCHTPPFFTDFGYHNNGLDSVFLAGKEGMVYGRFRITLDSADMGKYKTPSLRNIALTAPYMHDGRFQTLEEVLAHYESGVRHSETVAPVFFRQKGGGIPFKEGEKEAIIAFLESLTDSSFVSNKMNTP